MTALKCDHGEGTYPVDGDVIGICWPHQFNHSHERCHTNQDEPVNMAAPGDENSSYGRYNHRIVYVVVDESIRCQARSDEALTHDIENRQQRGAERDKASDDPVPLDALMRIQGMPN